MGALWVHVNVRVTLFRHRFIPVRHVTPTPSLQPALSSFFFPEVSLLFGCQIQMSCRLGMMFYFGAGMSLLCGISRMSLTGSAMGNATDHISYCNAGLLSRDSWRFCSWSF